MITKGTEEYKQAAELANKLQDYASTERTNSSFFEISFNRICIFIEKIIELNVFASKIAETVDKTMNPYKSKTANISSKQAWVLACAAIENKIEF